MASKQKIFATSDKTIVVFMLVPFPRAGRASDVSQVEPVDNNRAPLNNWLADNPSLFEFHARHHSVKNFFKRFVRRLDLLVDDLIGVKHTESSSFW
jgi:hypothetical protein